MRDINTLLRLSGQKQNVFQPYKGLFLPEADRFMSIRIATEWASFGVFINKANQTFCETIDRLHSTKAFFNDFKKEFPELFYAFNRVRVYRNEVDHLALNKPVQSAFEEYIEQDLLGRSLTQIKEPWFVLQQVVLDEIFVALQYEINANS